MVGCVGSILHTAQCNLQIILFEIIFQKEYAFLFFFKYSFGIAFSAWPKPDRLVAHEHNTVNGLVVLTDDRPRRT
jgi:hypothetical protein